MKLEELLARSLPHHIVDEITFGDDGTIVIDWAEAGRLVSGWGWDAPPGDPMADLRETLAASVPRPPEPVPVDGLAAEVVFPDGHVRGFFGTTVRGLPEGRYLVRLVPRERCPIWAQDGTRVVSERYEGPRLLDDGSVEQDPVLSPAAIRALVWGDAFEMALRARPRGAS